MRRPAKHSRGLGAEWQEHMVRGQFDRAWQVCDAVLEMRRGQSCSHLPRHEQWFWDGTPLDGRRVLVRCYHGLGDTLQFIRYAPLVRERSAEVAVWAQPSLLPAMRGVRGVDRWLPLHDGDVGIDYDVDVEIMELPHVFRTTLDTLPADVPYVNVAPLALDHVGRLKIGIVWKAGDWARNRSVPFHLLSALFELPVQWYILQSEAGLLECPRGLGIRAGTNDPLELAGVIRSLDLVITIDSMPAHLAGALGVPVWTLLPMPADWRWMEGRDDSPWYPTMRLFRQSRPGDWSDVVARVTGELRTLIESQRRGEPTNRRTSEPTNPRRTTAAACRASSAGLVRPQSPSESSSP